MKGSFENLKETFCNCRARPFGSLKTLVTVAGRLAGWLHGRMAPKFTTGERTQVFWRTTVVTICWGSSFCLTMALRFLKQAFARFAGICPIEHCFAPASVHSLIADDVGDICLMMLDPSLGPTSRCQFILTESWQAGLGNMPSICNLDL